MNSKLLLPIFSLVVRGSILAVLTVVSVGVYFGALVNTGTDIFTYLASTTGLISLRLAELLKISVIIVFLLIILVYSLRRDRLGIGLLRFMGLYSLSLLTLVAIVEVVVMAFLFIRGMSVFSVGVSLVIVIVLGLLVVIFSKKYPLISITLSTINNDGSESQVFPGISPLILDNDQVLRIKLYGSRNVKIIAEPSENLQVSGLVKGLIYDYIDVKPLTPIGGKVKIYYNDMLIYNMGIKARNVELKNILFTIYFNDDLVYEQEYRVGLNEALLNASRQAVNAALARLGLSFEDVKEIQFYTGDNIRIPQNASIRDIVNVDKVLVKIYSAEKHLELLKYYRKADVFKLWDSLMKRLELLAENMMELESLIDSIVSELNTISRNWW
ncbi:hypothetical protein [Staphylothermus hellenicus]|uniref:Uncharacterized protein n=1 Tax=Staphylothermus hellenicus (strain DSM 12710 / JCM 10830 / BK20S6-10-b1 / P8) TaxID=591019 RepID=D7D9D4_STAHD|nr:hypothetical protein [Staphylothermus hellenicus]ADI32380.1 hypothetical protein Shell_1287 [Staphylothermus hellenicus DSM 12710]